MNNEHRENQRRRLSDLREAVPLLRRDGRQALLLQARDRVRVVAQIKLGPDEDERHAGRVVRDLRVPFLPDVVQGRRRDDRKAEEENVRLRVRQRLPGARANVFSGALGAQTGRGGRRRTRRRS